MPARMTEFTNGEVVDPAKNLLHICGIIRLRRKSPGTGSWIPGAPYVAEGRLLIDNWKPKLRDFKLTGFLATTAIREVPEDVTPDQVLFRLSPDGGTTELWWDGAAWSVATDPVVHWNTEDVIDAHIATFPVGIGVAQIVRLVSGTGESSPELHATDLFWEGEYEAEVDLCRSLAEKIRTELKVQGEYSEDFAAPTATVTVDDPVFALDTPIRVFNETTDPDHTTDLYASNASNVVTLTSPQTGRLLVEYVGRVTRIHIATDADVEQAELPAVVIQTPDAENTNDERNPAVEELLRSIGTVRLRESPTRQRVSTTIQCQAVDDYHARKLSDATRLLLKESEKARSIALDEDIPLAVGSSSQDNDLSEQVFTKNITVVAIVTEHERVYTDKPMVAEVQLNAWPSNSTFRG